jgi:predicted  nucleic acid-binding Zn-ribbon protein
VAFLERAECFSGIDEDCIVSTGSEKLFAVFYEADSYRDRCRSLSDRVIDEQGRAASLRAELKKEKESLEKGVYQFPQDTVDLKEAIESRLRSRFGSDAKVVIVAEAAEILCDRWRNVIEGYLNMQKFYVIVAPEHFYVAFQLYDSIKKQKTVYATGLVDTEKLLQLSPTRDKGSLAEELDTTNPAVRLFLDYTLGRVKKCDSIRELRRNKTSVTDDGVLYQNFVVRAMDPKRWKDPAIGQGGARLRLEAVNKELERLFCEVSIYAVIISALKGMDGFLRRSESEAEQIVNAAKEYQSLPSLEEMIARLKADLAAIDRSEIESLKTRLLARENTLEQVRLRIRKLDAEGGKVKEKLRLCTEETIPSLETSARQKSSELETRYLTDWVTKIGRIRYDRELLGRKSADEIYKAFPREQARSCNSKVGAWDKTRDLRSKYNHNFKMGYDINALENEVYNQVYIDCSENRLPEYATKIEDARQKAFQQFQEDFLSRLKHNIDGARRHIEELNSAIKGASFGEDTYRFRVIAKPEYKRYHDMIIDDMLTHGGLNLFSGAFNTKYRDEIKELFDYLTNDNAHSNAHGHEDYEKRVQIFTDYKTYLDFDLEVVKPNGETERLSKTMGKKSGGETQTPFYIAVLASFKRLYREERDKTQNTARLILFDEAFSKMDSERIIRSIELLRRFDFQVVLSAPPDKAPDIATQVDRILYVHRERHEAHVKVFSPRQWEEQVDEG